MELPDKYWHCQVEVLGKKGYGVVNDLSLAELHSRIVEPWHKNAAFPVAGVIVTSRDKVEKIRITHTSEAKEYYAEQFNAERRRSSFIDLSTDRKLVPIWRGTDYTHDLLFANLGVDAPEPEVGLILRLCERLPAAARILANRRKGKKPFTIKDEYDVQDLLHSILRAYLKYSVQEEPLAKIGAAQSGRADIAIEELRTIIEVKFARGPSDQQKFVTEYSNDLLLYTKWPHLENFVYMIYNSQDLKDPEALDKLAGKQTVNGVTFMAHIVRA